MEASEFTCKEASSQDLERRWDINITNNPGDNRWAAWKKVVISENQNNILKTFVVLHGNEPIGEGTLIFLPQNSELNGRHELANGTTIGVEAKETRNLAIYLHWGYDRFVTHAIEDDELVLYYSKKL